QAFLQAIQGGTSDGFTPLRYAMHGVGNYFERTDSRSPWRTDPASSSSGNDQLACRRSYHILTTDGYYNDNTGNRNYPGRNDAVGNVDGKTINGGPNGAVSYQARAPYQDTQSNTLADIAMHFWARDLQSDIANQVPTVPQALDVSKPALYYNPDNNPANWQHLTQFTISIGMQGTLNPSTALAGLQAGTTSWPSTTSDEAKIDDLWHAAVNSRG